MKSDDRTDGLLKAGKLIAEQPRDHQKAYITRAALEELCNRAGVKMDWNDGNPVFPNEDMKKNQKLWDRAAQKLAEERIHELEKIAGMAQSGMVSQAAANSMAKAAAQSMDSMVSDVLKKKVEETLKQDIVKNEERVKDQLRKAGASDDDIAAAEKLLGKVVSPMPPEREPLFIRHNTVVDETHTMLKRAIDTLKYAGVKDPGTFIVHPDFFVDVS